MLISRQHDGLQLVTHPEHARIAGAMAASWGNGRFPRSVAPDSLTLAATRHDDGWAGLDGAPCINAEEGRPAHFLEVPLTETVVPYGEGVDAVYGADLRAGVLCSMHRAGLWSSRWGVQDGEPVGHPLALEVVAAEELRVADRTRELWQAEGGLRSAFEAALWRDYETLQALDLLSLAVCLLDTRTPSDPAIAPPRMAATLRELDQPAGGRIIARVPATGGEHIDLRLDVVEPHVVAIGPSPLSAGELPLQIEARRLADRPYEDPAGAFHAAERLTVPVTLVAA
jgi:hypothetical protein